MPPDALRKSPAATDLELGEAPTTPAPELRQLVAISQFFLSAVPVMLMPFVSADTSGSGREVDERSLGKDRRGNLVRS